jgi:two-component system CheB/CheR fusion protein
VVLVQDPKSAKYDGMPRSAVATGLADVILPPNEMPEKLLAYVRRAPGLEPKGRADAPRVAVQLQKIFILLRAHTGHDLSLYKHSTILRRIAKRMAFHQFERMDDYVRRLQEDAQEVALLFKDCLIAVTGFFRDPEAFQTLQAKIIPELVAGEPADHPIRVWVPGCSTGEEAYSLAILLKEYLEEHKLANPVQIFATDIDHDAIEAARLGAYPGGIVADVSPERLQRFFVQEDNRYRVKKAVRDMLVFADQNLVRDPPFTKLDLISCRNLLIYMETELQKQVFPLFHYALNRGGISSSALRRASASSATSSPSSTANGSSSGSGEM